MKVRIEDMYDGFAVEVYEDRIDGKLLKRVSIDQEETREALKDVFAALGIECVYEEVY